MDRAPTSESAAGVARNVPSPDGCLSERRKARRRRRLGSGLGEGEGEKGGLVLVLWRMASVARAA